MSLSQERYMDYFSQIYLHDLTPLSKPLILNKILIVIDEPSIESPSKVSDDSAEGDSKTGGDHQHNSSHTSHPANREVTDYSKITENLFFRIYEGSVEEEILIFDQLD